MIKGFIGFLFLLFICGRVFASPVPEVLEVHSGIGVFVDSLENAQYRIIGPLPGFAGAKFYCLNDRVILHLFAKTEQGAGFWILKMSRKSYEKINSKLASRVKSGVKADTSYLYPIESDRLNPAADHNFFLRDGSMFHGTIYSIVTDTLNIVTPGGIRVAVPDQTIDHMENIANEIRMGGFYRADPNTSRLLFAPTGRTLKSGAGYLADYYVFFPTLAFGITDYFTLSGGMSILPGADSQVLYFAPKLSIPLAENIDAGTGLLYLAIPEEEDDLSLGYGVVTFGGVLQSLTLGVGVPLTQETDGMVVLVVGGEKQVSNSVKLLTENWIFTGDDSFTMLSGAVRFFGDRLAVDLALLTTVEAFEGDGFPFLPWVDFSYSFGH